jgi:hypothetical protein
MLYEDNVVDAVCDHLRRHGFIIKKKCASTMRGDDIIAQGIGSIRELYIEAKGETSNAKGSLRYGHPFNDSQILVHVANAFYRAAKMATNGRVGGIALPDNSAHRKRVAPITHALDRLGIIVFWVAADRTVSTSRHIA